MEALQYYKKVECINGVVYNMSPPDNKHRTIQGNLYLIIGNFLRGKRCRVFFESEVRFAGDIKVQPDLFVVCDHQKIKNKYIDGAPDFVVEILSLSTRRRDLTVKKDVYEKFGVKEYWIIDPKAESIDVYLLKDGKYVLDNTYQNISESEAEEMDEEEKAEIRLSLKLSLYDDLEIHIRDVFEGIEIFAV